MSTPARFQPEADSLDPTDWQAFRELGHRMVDDMADFMAGLRERPVWQPMPAELRAELRQPLPQAPAELAEVYADFQRLVQPYVVGNVHPRFLGWVQGAGNPVGVLAELLAATMNANLGGRDHAPIEVERQVIRWAAEMLGFPLDASGVLVTGTSLANLIAVLVARTRALGRAVRQDGLAGRPLVAYTSTEAHNCVSRAMDMAGFGTAALRLIPCDDDHRMRLDALAEALAADRAAGLQPFLLVGSAGTVDTGAIDPLAGLARVAREQGLWFHVDAAFGALAMLSPEQRPLLAGLDEADSVAFDFHKWAQVPYDAGCIVVRDAAAHAAAFATVPAYLRREARGLAAGQPWPTDFGPDLSRGFRALKVWMTIRTYGADKLGEVIARNCALARRLAARVDAEPELRRVAPVALNVVCFRFEAAGGDLDRFNADLVADLQESGIAVPSTTTIRGQLAVRVALVNHRTRAEDLDLLVDALLAAGRRRAGAA
ncbi:pyridoxal phosphate-dependent decarboxylase family protein [Chitinimonas koreensis]|uniref:pyridoxal phosphate-dependent decarboxylase family protein n=1 Tax=Chitinimonas koreensis TaxID=356302 RepID=UPI00040E1772|nr:pyridoxal-dependent decarboxylase [Chitinimonas koreensis]QNM97657.1 aminotransferase class V-fold PLP-dependent enzyme [Chitinimonas koreensis]